MEVLREYHAAMGELILAHEGTLERFTGDGMMVFFIGFEGRWDYGAIGTVTNLAARLCGEAKPGQVLISRRLLATIEHLVEAEPVGKLALKGFHRPVTGYSVVRLKE
jgi:adenylate cyclase